MPDDAFGNARTGDLVVGRLRGAPPDRVVYGVVGDTGPIAQFGEASIAFNRALLAKSAPIVNDHDVDSLDIDGGAVTLVLLGGTKSQLDGDYSAENIASVGRREFARWNADPSAPARRLDACIAAFGAGGTRFRLRRGIPNVNSNCAMPALRQLRSNGNFACWLWPGLQSYNPRRNTNIDGEGST